MFLTQEKVESAGGELHLPRRSDQIENALSIVATSASTEFDNARRRFEKVDHRFEEVELAVVGVDDKVDVMAADLAETKAGLKKEVKRLRSELGLSSTKLKKRRCKNCPFRKDYTKYNGNM